MPVAISPISIEATAAADEDDLHVAPVLGQELLPARRRRLGRKRVRPVLSSAARRPSPRRGPWRDRRRASSATSSGVSAYQPVAGASLAARGHGALGHRQVLSFGSKGLLWTLACACFPRTASGCWASTAPARRTRGGSAAWASSRPGRERLVGDLAEQVGDDVEPAALLVVVVARCATAPTPSSVAANIASRARQVVVAAAVGLQIRGRELPDLARVVDPALEPPGLLVDG